MSPAFVLFVVVITNYPHGTPIATAIVPNFFTLDACESARTIWQNETHNHGVEGWAFCAPTGSGTIEALGPR